MPYTTARGRISAPMNAAAERELLSRVFFEPKVQPQSKATQDKTMKILIIFFVVLIFAIQQPDLFSYSSGLHALRGACLVGRVAVAGLCVRVRQKARLVVKHASGSGEALLR